MIHKLPSNACDTFVSPILLYRLHGTVKYKIYLIVASQNAARKL